MVEQVAYRKESGQKPKSGGVMRIISHFQFKKMECCTVTKGRVGESGAWCVDCGKKVLAVEYRECGGCLNFKDGVCTRFLMGVPKTMLATYKINDGTCFVPA